MPISDTEIGLESKRASTPPKTASSAVASIAEAFAARLKAICRLGRSDRGLATLLLYDRFCLASSLNEGDAGLAIMNALIDHCENYPHVEIDERMMQDLRWLLARNHDVSILCGHVRVYADNKKTKHADRVIKLTKRLVMS